MEKGNSSSANLQTSESGDNMASRPSGSLVKIDSITIDLGHIELQKIDEGKERLGSCCHSFSIRGYVSEMREKDMKICSPFANSSNCCAVDDDPPPMVAPKFRWWRCENCIKDLPNENGGNEADKVPTSAEGERTPLLSTQLDETNADEGVGNKENTSGGLNIITSNHDLSLEEVLKDDTSVQEREKRSDDDGGGNRIAEDEGKALSSVQQRDSRFVLDEDDGDGIASITLATPFTNSREAVDVINLEEGNALSSVNLRNDTSVQETQIRSDEGVDISLQEYVRDDDREGSSESDGVTGRARFRSLTDLLSGKVNPENTSAHSAQPSYSDEPEKGNRKRKMPQGQDIVGKNPRVFKDVVERSPVANYIPDSAPERFGSAEGARPRIRQPKRRIDKEAGVMRKKSKQNHGDEGCSSLFPWPTTPVGSGDLKKCGPAANPLSTYQPITQSKKISSYVSLSNNKLPEIGYFPPSLVPRGNHWFQESSVKGKSIEPWSSHPQAGNFRMPQDVSAKDGLDLSLNSFRDTAKASMEIDFNQSVNLKKGDRMSDPRRKKGIVIREENAVKGGLLCDLNAQTSLTFRGKQKMSDQDANKNKKSRRLDGGSEEGLSDDIPMEIVELMAQNQYERGLGENPRSQVQVSSGNGGKGNYGNNNMVLWKSPTADYFQFRQSSKIAGHIGSKIGQVEENRPQFSLRNGSQFGEPVSSMWLPFGTNTTPYGRGTFPDPTSQAKNKETDAQVHKGKTISDIKANEMKRQSDSHPFFMKPSVTLGPLESYPNEAIPAMQLLSLMDRKVPSNRTFNLEKPFAPCDYHPSFSRDVTQNFLDRSLLPPHHYSKPFSGFSRPGVSNLGESSRQSLPSAFNQIAFKAQEQEKSRRLYSSQLLGGSKFQSSASSSGALHMAQGSFPVSDMQRGFLSRLPGPITFPLQGNMPENRRKYYNATWPPLRSFPENNICSLNQNPAEFSVPEAGNVYTISGKDLKNRKKNFPRERSAYAANMGIRKRQRNNTNG